jgi:hypothetical protein
VLDLRKQKKSASKPDSLECAAASSTNQSIIVWTSKTKSLLPSLYKREEFPLFGKEGSGEIFTTICLFNYGLLCNICKGYSKIPTRLIYPSNLASTDKQYQFWYQLLPECPQPDILALLSGLAAGMMAAPFFSEPR